MEVKVELEWLSHVSSDEDTPYLEVDIWQW